MAIYTPADWYWIDGKSAVYGSARNGLVASPSSDSAYLAFQASGAKATPLSGDDFAAGESSTLDGVLEAAGLPLSGLAPPTKADLLAYANAKVKALLEAPTPYTLATGVVVTNDATPQTASDLTGLLLGPAAMAPTDMTQWTDNIGVVNTLTQPQVGALAIAVTARAKSIYAVLAPAATGIGAGSITTTGAIDALSWPA